MSSFVHLTAHSQFSLLEGMASVSALAKQAAKLGMPALAITETNTLFSAVEASRYLPQEGVQPILGVQLGVFVKGVNALCHVTLLVQNKEGWQTLLTLISVANRNKLTHPQGFTGVDVQTLISHTRGVIVLAGTGVTSPLLPALLQGDAVLVSKQLGILQEAFGNRFYVDIQRHGLPHEEKIEFLLLKLADELGVPLVATNDCRFLSPDDLEAYEALVCIGDGLTLDDQNRRQFTPHFSFKSSEEMEKIFSDLPDAIANTGHIAKRCAYLLEQVDIKKMSMPQWPTKPEESVADVLRIETQEGLRNRLENFVFTKDMAPEKRAEITMHYQARLEEELAVIIPMEFSGYFLITSDFIRWAKSQDIPVGPGRGSGAGSLVAWCLDITDLDPIEWDLYFERFLNPERISLPDFDIDFCQDRRDEVIKYVQQKYGDAYVTQIITFGSLKAKACIRDVGRVLQMNFFEVGRIAGYVPEVPNPPSIKEVLEGEEKLRALYHESENVQRLLDMAMKLEGCYRHASTHAAGVIIADKKIEQVCGIYCDARSTIPATQFSMNDAEYIGLVKFDFLGLKTLSIIQRAVNNVQARVGEKIDILGIPLDDDKTYSMLRGGHTVGVFQIESAGMTDLTKKLQPTNMDHLAAVICLFRPGPMELMPDFVARHLGEQPIEYDHPKLEAVLKETNGVAIYQEQVMMMARVLAGYTLGGADNLRRAMGKKKPAEMAKQRKVFVAGCASENDIPAEEANRIFDKISAFAGYGFNKAHTLAYTLIAYQTAWLKAHYPADFMASSMTYDRGNTVKLLKYKQELERMNIPLLLPDVNASQAMFAVEKMNEGEGIRYAFSAIKGTSEEAMHALVKEREDNGAYKDIYDFLGRQDPHMMNKRQLEALVRAGALDSLYPNRAEIIENEGLLLAYLSQIHEEKNSNQIGLFGGGSGSESGLPKPKLTLKNKWDMFEKLENEQQVIGFYLSAHPMEAYTDMVGVIAGLKPISVLEEMAQAGRKGARVAGVVLDVRTVKTKKGDRMGIITVSDTSGQAELAVFPETFANVEGLLGDRTPLLINVNMSVDDERIRMNAEVVSVLESVANQRHVDIHITNLTVLDSLKEALLSEEKGRTKCRLHVPLDEKIVALELPNPINFTRKLKAKIEAFDGVRCEL